MSIARISAMRDPAAGPCLSMTTDAAAQSRHSPAQLLIILRSARWCGTRKQVWRSASRQAHLSRMTVTQTPSQAGTQSQTQAAAMTTADGLVTTGVVGTQLLMLLMEHHSGHAGLLVDIMHMTPALWNNLKSMDWMASITPSVRGKALLPQMLPLLPPPLPQLVPQLVPQLHPQLVPLLQPQLQALLEPQLVPLLDPLLRHLSVCRDLMQLDMDHVKLTP
mmetsp:Transcript_17306/g.20786  ORF Transcript_17306/g.20786 Transcript_17306/m.20786 type:complete len:220 (+) Transcript_17306:1115-1774(+)